MKVYFCYFLVSGLREISPNYGTRKKKSLLTSITTIKMINFDVNKFYLMKGVLFRYFHLEIA